MSFFGFGKKNKLGIDLGTSSIKIVELSKESGRFRLENYGLFELNSENMAVNIGTQSPGTARIAELSNDDITQAIRQLLQTMKTKTTIAIGSIQSFSTFSTVITMPYLSEEDLAKTIPFEARKYIPIPLNDVVLDWSIINTGAQVGSSIKAGSNVDIFLVAVPKEETLRYQSIVAAAGLQLKALELENSALIRALIGNDLNPYAIVNIGGRSTSIVIVDGGVERVSHNYEVGGFEITRAIAQALRVSIQRAEELKRSFGLKDVNNNMINGVMSSLLDMMALETKKTIQNYEQTTQRKMANVLLVGGLANMPQFLNYFGGKLGASVSLGNVLARVIIPGSLDKLKTELNSTFAVALGLAMRDI